MLIQQVIHDEPPSPRQLNSRVPRDLETICLKCLEKDPGKRYATAQQLSEELRRFLQGRPIQARRIPVIVRGWRWCKRNPMAATAVALLLLVAVVGPIVATREASLRSAAENARIETYTNLYVADMRLAHHAWDVGDIQLLERLVDRHRYARQNEQDLRGFGWRYLRQRLRDVENTPTLHFANGVADVAHSTDASALAVASGTEIHIFDVRTRKRKQILNAEGKRVSCLAFSPGDNRVLASAAGNRALLWDTVEGRVRSHIGNHAADINCLEFSPDGTTLAYGMGRTIILRNVISGQEVARFELTGPGLITHASSLAFSPDGRILATANQKTTLNLFDLTTFRRIVTLLPDVGHNNAVVFSPDGRILVSAGNDSLIRFWDTDTWKEMAVIPGNSAPIFSMNFLPDGTLVTGGLEGTIKLWDTSSRMVKATLRGHKSNVLSIDSTPNGNTLASGSSDGTVMLWNMRNEYGRDTLVGNKGIVHVIAFAPNARTLVSATPLGTLALWDTATRTMLNSKQFDTSLWSVACAPDGKTLALGTHTGLLLWDIGSWQQVDWLCQQEQRQQTGVMCLRFSPNGDLLAAGSWPVEGGGTVVIWDLEAGRVLTTIKGFDSWYGGLAFSPNGTTLAIPKANFNVVLWNTASRTDDDVLIGHSQQVKSVAFSPDGRTLATASAGTILLWDVAHGELRTKLKPDQARLEWVAFSPDGTTLASSGRDGTIKLWSLASSQHVGTLRGHVGPVGGLAFSRDGRLLASGGWDKTIRLWPTANAADVATRTR